MAGTVVIDTVQSSVSTPPVFKNTNGTEIGQLCRAWVNFNGVTTATIRASFNVSSVTRLTTGRFQINFTNSLPDANYSVVSICCIDGTFGVSGSIRVCNTESMTTQLTTSCIIGTTTTSSTVGADPTVVMASFFR